ncbi:hypothetical protein T552_01232 [Pneumocystis carinii B80]|uniref:60S acidic ribosomal protein P0 n=1 Tax=Pneumocystis carinii (strain B80) TaxID=1408658 RepID=A0A0W4ZLM5_PNEC8|nr:hypothetical protein T552_01232 [Pneumocystis carinii B80]KTW29277.1 hypothetical protein T552_01232 [Pneumocystis carinii B80]
MKRNKEQKKRYFCRLHDLFSEYKSIFVVNINNVGSQQMHMVRKELRGSGVIFCGKNTMIRRAMRDFLTDLPYLETLLPVVYGNIAFVFTNDDLKLSRTKIMKNVVSAPAKAGIIAPCDVIVPAGNTGMEPGKTSFFQALGIPTKIARGTIEIISDVHLIHAQAKVGASEATFLNMLNIMPFTYGITILHVYDQGILFSPSILDITEEAFIGYLKSAIQNVASISLALNYMTIVSALHSLVNSYKNLQALSIASDYIFEGTEKIKNILENPDAYVVASAPVVECEAPPEEESVEEEDEDMGLSLFD